MRRAAGLLALLLPLVPAVASAERVLFVPPVGVGSPAPEASVVMKVGELLAVSARRAGMSEAPASVDPGAQRVELARGLYFDLKFDAALTSAKGALDHYRANPHLFGDGTRLIAAHVYAAMSLQQLGKKAEADEALLAALTLKSDLQLSDAEFPPAAISALERVRATLGGRARASVTISTSPAFGRVSLDGRAVGEAPVVLEGVLPGEHHVQITRDGHKPIHAWVAVKAPATDLPFTLTPDRVESLTAQLAAQVAAGAGAELEQTAAALAAEAGVDSVILVAVGRGVGRHPVVAARVPARGAAVRSFSHVGLDLFDAAPALDKLAQALKTESSAAPIPLGAPLEPSPFDFGAHWMGLSPPPAAIIAPVEPPPPPPPAETPLWKRPWVWGAAAGVLAASAGGIYYFTRPPPPAPGVSVSVEFPQ